MEKKKKGLKKGKNPLLVGFNPIEKKKTLLLKWKHLNCLSIP